MRQRSSALAVSGSTVYVGDDFTSIGGKTRRHLAALKANSAPATPWNPDASGDGRRPRRSGATVYAGGTFDSIDSIGGQTRYCLARFSPITGPWVGSLRPARGRVGAAVTLTGWNFGATRGTAKVYFGGKAATRYVSWSATEIRSGAHARQG